MQTVSPDPVPEIDTLRFILGDQLSHSLSALTGGNRETDIILMVEVAEETVYAPHHKKKIAFILAAMRAFAARLRAEGWRVDYVALDDPANTGSFTGELARALKSWSPRQIVATEASEWRVVEAQRGWEERLACPVTLRPDTRFICSEARFIAWTADRKQLRMEYFYRDMRRLTGLLMEGEEPIGGQWNFDAENRKPAGADLFMPQPSRFAPSDETRAVLDLVAGRFAGHFGDLEPFWFAVTHEQAEAAFAHFLKSALPQFGDYQDAMRVGEKFLYHSVVSLYLNVGLLDPLDMCRRAEAEYAEGRAPLNAVEGFIRQIIGWREYMRGIYWREMPGYTARNALGATRALPALYWTGATKMTCMAEAIGQTKTDAYAHHIQRLMVTGNFALIAGIDPHQVHEWYLAVYADAFEWVEAPNVIGMSQFADGGLLGSKPYAASGAYIDRMSNYCRTCVYDVKAKTGPKACPFNYLYWDFMERNRVRLGNNPRMGPMYRTLDRLAPERCAEIAASASVFLDKLDANGTDLEQTT
jgi:deoxyribodipyrimidine photolyase-related protein